MGIFGTSQQGQPRYSGELHNLQVTESVYGTCCPIVFGTCRVHGKLLFYGGFYATPAPNTGKGVFGGKTTEYEYYADTQILLAQGALTQACKGLLNVWDQNGKLENLGGSYPYTIPGSSPTVIPSTSPAVNADLGVYKTVSYSVTANDYGAGGSQTLTGTQQVAFTRVASSPASGEYTFDETTGEYGFSTADVGVAVSIQYSTVFSLYYYQQTQAAEIPGSPFQVSTDNQAYFSTGVSVTFVDTGALLTRVGGTPSATGEYNQTNGVYTFYSGDAGRYVYIDYTYTSSDPNLTNSSTLNLTFFNGAQGQNPSSYMTSKYPSAAFGYSALCYLLANPLALGESASMPDYNYEVIGLAPFGGGVIDAHPCDALRLLLTDPLLGVGFPSANVDSWTNAYAYWASNSYFISISIDTQTPAAQALQAVIEAGNVAPVWSGGLLKLIPYGDTTTVGNGYTYTPPTTPAFTLTWDDLLPQSEHEAGESTSDDPLQCTVKAPQDCMNYVQAQWTNRANDYNNELTPQQNDAFIKLYGFRPESPQTWDFITTQTAANFALQLRLKRNCYIRNTYKFWLPFWFSALEPMDLVVLPTGEPVRITQIEDAVNGRLSIEAEQWTYGSADVTIYPNQEPDSYQPVTSQAVPGLTYAVIFEATPQSVLAKPNTVQIAVAGNQANWGGCNIYVANVGTGLTLNITATAGVVTAAAINNGGIGMSVGDTFDIVQDGADGATWQVTAVTSGVATAGTILTGGELYRTATAVPTTADATAYSLVDTVFSQGRTGLLSAALASSADPDTTDTLSVDMTISGGELVSVTQAQADAFATLSAIVDQAGTIELVSYENATLTAQDRYNLTYLRRGVYGTTIGAHAIGAEFSYLGTSGIEEYQYPAQFAGRTVYFKFSSFNLMGNQNQSLSECLPYLFLIPGTSLQPPSAGSFSTVPSQPLSAQVWGSGAQITVSNFTAQLNNQSVACTVTGTLNSLTPDQSYFVYYIDKGFLGGVITPIATQNIADFQNKTGYYQLLGPNADGSITMPVISGPVYRPTSYLDTGSSTTTNPTSAYDNSPNSAASLLAFNDVNGNYIGTCEFYVFSNVTISSGLTLTVSADSTVAGTGVHSATIKVSLDGGSTFTTIASLSTTTTKTSYTLAVPSGTNLQDIQVVCNSQCGAFTGASTQLQIYDINVQ